MASLIDEHTQFLDSAGTPIVNGYVYIGSQNQDPVLNPITIYSDRALTTTLSNPQRTDANGRTTNKIYAAGRYSIKVEDANNVQRYQELDNGEEPASGITTLTNVQGINAITAEASPAITSYTDGEIYVLKAANANTGAVTLDAGGGAKDVRKNGADALAANEITGDTVIIVAYNSTSDDFDLLSLQQPFTMAASLPAPGADGHVLASNGSAWVSEYNGMEPVARVDLTNGGADDLSEADVTLTGGDGWGFLVLLRDVSTTSSSYLPGIRFQTTGGSFRTGASDYYEQYATVAGAGSNGQAGASIRLSAVNIASAAHTFDAWVRISAAGDTGARTKVVIDSILSGATTQNRYSISGNVQTAEGNDELRVLTSAGTFDGGEMFVWRMREAA